MIINNLSPNLSHEYTSWSLFNGIGARVSKIVLAGSLLAIGAYALCKYLRPVQHPPLPPAPIPIPIPSPATPPEIVTVSVEHVPPQDTIPPFLQTTLRNELIHFKTLTSAAGHKYLSAACVVRWLSFSPDDIRTNVDSLSFVELFDDDDDRSTFRRYRNSYRRMRSLATFCLIAHVLKIQTESHAFAALLSEVEEHLRISKPTPDETELLLYSKLSALGDLPELRALIHDASDDNHVLGKVVLRRFHQLLIEGIANSSFLTGIKFMFLEPLFIPYLQDFCEVFADIVSINSDLNIGLYREAITAWANELFANACLTSSQLPAGTDSICEFTEPHRQHLSDICFQEALRRSHPENSTDDPDLTPSREHLQQAQDDLKEAVATMVNTGHPPEDSPYSDGIRALNISRRRFITRLFNRIHPGDFEMRTGRLLSPLR